ncbi:MAG: hypothetical protein LBS55_10295 [Prevotellaceae bacterium]|nr:hypothetical protein [Prevotellaceae bacterium]
MKDIIVNYNGEEMKVVVHLHNNNGNSPALADGESRMYIGGVDYKECKRYTWNEYNPIKIGDKFEIKFTEIDVCFFVKHKVLVFFAQIEK